MRGRHRWSLLSLLLAAAAAAACAAPRQPAWSPVPIADVSSLTGKWGGVLLRDPTDRRDDWLEMTIGPDGSFEARSYRLIGSMTGSGRFVVTDGRVTSRGQRATINGALFTAEGKRMLRLDALDSDGIRFRADLTPVR
jgi:hypothetical protein